MHCKLDKIDYGVKEKLLNYEKAWGDYFEENTDKGKIKTIFLQYFA